MKFSIVGSLALGTLGIFAAAQPASASQSHLAQKPERHVTLKSAAIPDDRDGINPCGDLWDRELVEVSPAGVVDDDPFRIPEGHTLVVTDIDWRVTEGTLTSFLPGDVLQFTLVLGNANSPVFRAGRLIGDHAAGGVVVESMSLTTGFRVAPGTPICPIALGVDKEGFTRHDVTQLILRGYVIQDSKREVTR